MVLKREVLFVFVKMHIRIETMNLQKLMRKMTVHQGSPTEPWRHPPHYKSLQTQVVIMMLWEWGREWTYRYLYSHLKSGILFLLFPYLIDRLSNVAYQFMSAFDLVLICNLFSPTLVDSM